MTGTSVAFPRLEHRAPLVAHHLDVRLKGALVLQNVNATFEPGRITAVIGANGAGKSTLLRTMAGLLCPDQGKVTLAGTPIRELDRRRLARSVAYLPQERVVHWPLSARAVVALGRMPHGANAERLSPVDEAAVERATAAMDITTIASRTVDTLSGGEKARVLFARALAQEAPIILADEPTAGLDPAHALELFAVLGRLAAHGHTIVIALHDLTFAARFCHDAVVLAAGRVVAAGPSVDVLTPERLGSVFGVRMAVGRIDNQPFIVPIAPWGNGG